MTTTFNLDALLTRWAKERPDELAFVDENIRVTFADINLDARKVANALMQSGVSRGDLVVIAFPPYLAWTFSFALQLLGATILPKSVEVKYQENIEIDWFIGLSPDNQIAPEKTILFTNEFLEKIKTIDPMERVPGYANSKVPMFLFSTSGTTGLKKYVAYDATQFTESTAPMWPQYWYGEDSMFSLSPYGGAASTIVALKRFASGSLFANSYSLEKKTISLITECGIKSMYAAPSQISGFLEFCEINNLDVPQVDLIVLAGSAPSVELLQKVKEQFKCKLFDAYGSSEGGSVARAEFTGEVPAGLSLDPNVDLQIVDEFDQVLDQGVVGQIRYKRMGMSHSYYKNEEASKHFFKDDYFYPGDLGFISENGKLVLAGRTTEVINLGGVKLNPSEIDDWAKRQGGVRDCAAFAAKGRDGLDELALAVIPTDTFNIDDFKAGMANPSKWSAIHVFLTDSLPYNENGKVMRAALAEQYRL